MKKFLFLTLSFFAVTTILSAQGSGGTNPSLIMYRYNSSSTLSPLPVLNGDLLGTLRWNGLVTYGNIRTGAAIQSYITDVAAPNIRANMIFQTSGLLPDGTGLTQLRDRMIITENGRVGIGTMTPLFDLHVVGNTHTTNRFHGRIHFDVGQPTNLPNSYNDEAYFERKSRATLGLAANTYADGGILSLAPGGSSIDRQIFSGGTDGLWTRSQDPLGGNTWAAWQQILTSAEINGNVGRVARFTGATLNAPSSSLGNSQLFDDGTRVGIRNLMPDAGTSVDILGATRIDGNLGLGILPSTYRLDVNGDANVSNRVIIGNPPTTPGSHRLYVNGSIIATEVRVALQASWSDYVFEKDYDLKSLAEVEKYVQENKHLPGVTSAKEVAENGLNLGEMQKMQMEKIEELYLHMIEMSKQLNALQAENQALKAKIEKLEQR